jgi:transposase-like protein
MRAAMEDMLGGAAWCARMAGQLGMVVSENTVYSWVRRAQLASHGDRVPDRGGVPAPVYRLGDVLDLIARSPRKVRA